MKILVKQNGVEHLIIAVLHIYHIIHVALFEPNCRIDRKKHVFLHILYCTAPIKLSYYYT